MVGSTFMVDLAEMLALLVHLLVLEAIGLVDLGGGQALQVFQKGIPQSGVLPPIFCQQFFGPALHPGNGHRDQWHTHQQHRRRGQIDERQHPKQGKGGQHRIKKLRQIRTEVGLQLVHPFHSHLHHLGCIDLLFIRSTQPQKLLSRSSPAGSA